MTNLVQRRPAITWPQIYASVGLTLAIAGAVGTAIVRYVYPAPFIGGFGFSEVAMLGYVVAGLSWASVGALLVVRRPENAVGWLMVVVGIGYAVSQATVALTFAFAAESTPSGDDLARLTGWVTVLLQLVTVLQFAIGFLFPTGRAQSPGWARFMRLFWAFVGVFVVISLTQPGPLQLIPAVRNPFGFGPDLRGDRLIAPILILWTLIIFVSLVVSMVTRYRSAGSVERQQLKWFVLALGLSAIALGIVSSPAIVTDRPTDEIGLAVFAFAGAFVPLAIGIAILRHHLYDIDRIISRTLAWAIVTGALVAVFVLAVISMQSLSALVGLHGAIAGVAQGETLAVAASTLLAFTMFQPLRQRVQRTVDRRFDRARYDADRTAVAFSQRLRHETDMATVTQDLARTTDLTMAPASLSIWLRGGRP